MVNVPLWYAAAVTVLFFFWIYGIVSFALDVKRKFVPMGRQYLRGRRQLKEEQRREEQREERERELY